jgi:hypothetical protein
VPDNPWVTIGIVDAEPWARLLQARRELDLAPDYLHKANISGGAPYAITAPNDAADAILENEEHALPFVEYLRLCFEWGGFPRLQRVPLSEESRRFLDGLRRDLLQL